MPRQKVLEVLAEQLKLFRQGKTSTVYLPFAYPIEGKVEPFLRSILDADAEKIYSNLTSFLADVVKGERGVYRGVLLREVLFNVARVTSAYGMMTSSLKALQVAGDSELLHDAELRSIARTCDAVLMAFGAVYSPLPKTRAFSVTPFTRAFMNTLHRVFTVADYVSAVKEFVECVASAYPEIIENTVELCEKVLSRWKHMGVESRNISNVIYTLYNLINHLQSL
jgi:hypothetical protein